MPDRSPLMSAANTGTPAREKPSASTCNVTVLPVPVAPVTRPCRLASASARYSGFVALADENFAVLIGIRHRSSPRPHSCSQRQRASAAASHRFAPTLSYKARAPPLPPSTARQRCTFATLAGIFIACERAQSHYCDASHALSLAVGAKRTIWRPISPGMRGVEGTMDELIGRLVANVGIDRAAAEKAVGIILDFLAKEGPADKVQTFARASFREPKRCGRKPRGDWRRPAAWAASWASAMRMMGAGLSMGQVQSVTRNSSPMRVKRTGEDAVGEIVGAIPGSRNSFECGHCDARCRRECGGTMSYPITDIRRHRAGDRQRSLKSERDPHHRQACCEWPRAQAAAARSLAEDRHRRQERAALANMADRMRVKGVGCEYAGAAAGRRRRYRATSCRYRNPANARRGDGRSQRPSANWCGCCRPRRP